MRVGIILLVVAAVLLAPVGLLWAFQRRLIYLPAPRTVPPVGAVLPGAQEVSFPTADGLRLGGWFLPARPGDPGDSPAQPHSDPGDSPAQPHPDAGYAPPPGGPPSDGRVAARPGPRGPAVLVCNGNGGNRSLRAPLAAVLARLGLAVLLFDYRGYGGNPGRPTEAGLATDARAALAYLAARPEVDPSRLAVFGESLGAAVALRLATERSPAALVLRSPFASLADVGRLHYPVLPVSLLLRDRYDSAAIAHQLDAPLLVVAGERDRTVPAAHSRRLYLAAPEPKRMVVLEGADHNDHELNDGPRLLAELQSFLGGVPGLLR